MNKIKIFEKNIKINTSGNVLKYLEISNKFPRIQEVYFSSIKLNKIKAWKKNITCNQFMYIFEGNIKFIIFDDRKSKSKKIHKFILGKNQKFSKILIPKNVWYGFKGLSKKNTLINALGVKHKNCKIVNLKFKNDLMPNSGIKF